MFRTKIDFKQTESYQERLCPGRSYYLEEGSNIRASYDDIVNEAVRIINCDLKPELQKYMDISIKEVQVQAVYKGSIEIIYTVIRSVLNLVSGLKDLYDVVWLISGISERHIDKKLSDRFGRHFEADTYVSVPENRDYWRAEEMRWNCSMDSNVKKCDAFFYYLMAANIVLMVIVGVLVFGAVKTVYF